MSIGETIGVAFVILLFLGFTHHEAYFEGWRRGYKEREKLEEQEK